jgi:hypothetical protein
MDEDPADLPGDDGSCPDHDAILLDDEDLAGGLPLEKVLERMELLEEPDGPGTDRHPSSWSRSSGGSGVEPAPDQRYRTCAAALRDPLCAFLTHRARPARAAV